MATVNLSDWEVVAKPKKKGASDTPRLDLPEIQQDVERLLQIKTQQDDLDAEKKAIERRIQPVADKALTEACRRDGKVHGSIRLNGSLNYERAQRSSVITQPAQIEALQVLYGEQFSELFVKKHTLVVPLEKVDEELKSKLIAIGVKPTFSLSPTEAYYTALALREDFQVSDESPKPQTCFKRVAKKGE